MKYSRDESLRLCYDKNRTVDPREKGELKTVPALEAFWEGLRFIVALFWGREQAIVAAHGMEMPLGEVMCLTFGYYYFLGYYAQSLIERLPKLRAKIEAARTSPKLGRLLRMKPYQRLAAVCFIAHFPSGFWIAWVALNVWSYSRKARAIIIAFANTLTYLTYEMVLGRFVERLGSAPHYFALTLQAAVVCLAGFMAVKHRRVIADWALRSYRKGLAWATG